MQFFQKIFLWFRRKEQIPAPEPAEERRSFSQYMRRTPEVVTYLRREKGIAKKNLELVLVDDEDRPAYQIAQIAEYLMEDLNVFYLVTGRADAFEELSEEAMEEYGLLLVLLPKETETAPGNLLLDVREWEKHLDILSAVSYNTLTIQGTAAG